MRRKIIWLTFWLTLVYWLGNAGGCASGEQNYKALEEDSPALQTAPRAEGQGGLATALAAAVRELTGQNQPPAKPAEPAATAEPKPQSAEPKPQVAQATPAPPQPKPTPTEPKPAPPQSKPAPTEPKPLPPEPKPAPPTQPTATPQPAPQPPAVVRTTAAPRVVTPPAPQPAVETEPSLTGIDRSHWGKITVGPDSGRTDHNPNYFRDVVVRRDDPVVKETIDSESAITLALSRDKAKNWSLLNASDLLVQPFKFGFDIGTLPLKMVMRPLWSRQTTPPMRPHDEAPAAPAAEPAPATAAAPADAPPPTKPIDATPPTKP